MGSQPKVLTKHSLIISFLQNLGGVQWFGLVFCFRAFLHALSGRVEEPEQLAGHWKT